MPSRSHARAANGPCVLSADPRDFTQRLAGHRAGSLTAPPELHAITVSDTRGPSSWLTHPKAWS